MDEPESLFDPALDAKSWFDPELSPAGWFGPEVSLAAAPSGADYTWYGSCSLTSIRTANDQPMTGGVTFGIGFGNPDAIVCRIVSVYDAADAVGRWKAEITIDDLGVYEFDDDAPWFDNLYIRVEATDVEKTFTCLGAWSFSASRLRCYYQVNGGGDVLLYDSVTPVVIDGLDYDPREDVMRVRPIHWLGTEDAQIEIFPDVPGDWTDVEYKVEGGFTFGWKYDTTEPTVSVEDLVPPTVVCDGCEYDVATITLLAPPTTWNVGIDSGMRYYVLRTDEGDWPYYCDLNNTSLGTPGTVHIDRVDWEYHNQPTVVDINDVDAGLLEAIKEAGARCFDTNYDPEFPYTITGPTTETDTVTQMAYRKEVVNLVSFTHVDTLLSPQSCPPLGEEEPPREPGHEGPSGEGYCYYQAYASYIHNYACGEGEPGHISADTGPDGRRVVALFEGSGNVFVKVYDGGNNLLDNNDLGFTANWVHIKIDKRTKPYEVLLFYELGAAIYLRISQDGGVTFGSAVAIAASGLKVTAEVSVDGTRFVYYITGSGPYDISGKRYDRGQNLLEAEFTAVSGVDNSGVGASAAPITGGQNRIVLDYWDGGIHTVKTSIDGITFV